MAYGKVRISTGVNKYRCEDFDHILNVQYRQEFGEVRSLVVWQEQSQCIVYIELIDPKMVLQDSAREY